MPCGLTVSRTASCCAASCKTSSPTPSNTPAGPRADGLPAARQRCGSRYTTPDRHPEVKARVIFQEFQRLHADERRHHGPGPRPVDRRAHGQGAGAATSRCARSRARARCSPSTCRSPRQRRPSGQAATRAAAVAGRRQSRDGHRQREGDPGRHGVAAQRLGQCGLTAAERGRGAGGVRASRAARST